MNPAIEEFSIQLEHDIDEQYQYAPGEQLRGEVVLSLHRTIDLHSIQVRVCGQSSVTWEENAERHQHPKRIQISHPEPTKRLFQTGEVYVDLMKDVFLAANGKTATLGPAGKQRFQFDFPLPLTIPSSFIGKFGCVTYVVIATLRQSMHSTVTNLVTSEPFVVMRRILLSDRPELLKPSESFVRRRIYGARGCLRRLVCCFLDGGKKLEVRFRVEKTGYLPGDDVVIGAAVDNRSSGVIEAFEAVLVMNSAFHAGSAVKESVQVVARERRSCVFQPRSGADVTEAIRLTVPPHVPESSLEGCAIIDVSYRVHLLFSVSEGLTFETNFPVTVVTASDQREGHQSVERSSSSSHSVRFSIPSTTTTTQRGNCTGSRYRKFSDSVVPDGGKTKSDDPDWDQDRDRVLDRFRHPMIPGETRENIIFKDDGTEDFYHTVL